METNKNINSLSYFQNLLESNKSQILIQLFISDFVINSWEKIFEIDNLNGVIKYYEFAIVIQTIYKKANI